MRPDRNSLAQTSERPEALSGAATRAMAKQACAQDGADMIISQVRETRGDGAPTALNGMNRRRVLTAMSSMLALAAASCGPRAADPLSVFDGQVDDWTRALLADSPELASQSGVSPELAGGPFQTRLDDRSPLAVEARRTAAMRRLTELRGLNSSALDPEDSLTYAVLDAQFSAAAAAAQHPFGVFSALGGISPYPLNPLDSAFITLPDFFESRHPIDSFADADAYLARLKAVAAAIDQETAHARLDSEAGVLAPGFIIDATLRQLDASIGQPVTAQTYFTSFARKLDALVARERDPAANSSAKQRAGALLARADAVLRAQVTPAHQRAAGFLRSVRARASDEAGVWRLPNGESYYADALRVATTTDLTPDQIHRIGLDRVRDLTSLMDVALRRIGMIDGPVGARMSAMTADPRYQYPDSDEGRAQLIADVKARVAKVMELAPRWFGTLPKAPLEVRRVPPAIEAVTFGAYYQPPTLDGSQPGIYHQSARHGRDDPHRPADAGLSRSRSRPSFPGRAGARADANPAAAAADELQRLWRRLGALRRGIGRGAGPL